MGEQKSKQKKTILLIDDSSANRLLWRQFLEPDVDFEWSLIEETSAAKAIKSHIRCNPDCIMIAGTPSAVNEALGVLRDVVKAEKMPIIALTDSDEDAIIEELIGNGVQECLNRNTVSPGRLRRTVSRVMEMWALERLINAQHSGTSKQTERPATGTNESLPEITESTSVRESEERLRMFAEGITDVFWIVDLKNLQAIYVDPAYEKLWGRSREPLYEDFTAWFKSIHLEDRRRVKTVFRKITKTGNYSEEYRIKRPDNKVRWIRDRGFLVCDENGEFVRIAGIAEDITERRESEARLRQNAVILKAVTESTSDLIFAKDFEGRIIMANPAAVRALGKPEMEILNKTDLDLQANKEEAARIREHDRQVMKNGKTEVVEEKLDLADGTHFYLTTKSPYFDERGQVIGLISIATDITDRKLVEVEREQMLLREKQAREIAETANRTKDDFITVVSHELRSPLNAILGWVRILKNGTTDANTIVHAIEVLERSARAQQQLIEDLLDTARITQGKLRLETKPIDLLQVVESATDALRPAAEAKAINLKVTLKGKDNIITGDPDRLQQVIWNLLSNAVKFTSEGGHVEVQLERADPYMRITVNDTGKGISRDLLPQIFNRFHQADASGKRRHGGLGLGLALVRHLVELHGGTIEARSPGEGQGATFIISLPLRALRSQVNQTERPIDWENTFEVHSHSLEGVKVLVIDDEADARELVATLLRHYGARVTAVSSAAEALVLLKSSDADTRPDVLVSDIGMPGEDGYSLIERIRRLTPQEGGLIPAIALTAYGRTSDRIRALSAGFQAHMPKPVEPAELMIVISGLSGRSVRGASI
jgi:PAS domain S-box-containing protein